MKAIKATKDKVEKGNKSIRDKISALPESAVLTEKQYEDQMSFVLKH